MLDLLSAVAVQGHITVFLSALMLRYCEESIQYSSAFKHWSAWPLLDEQGGNGLYNVNIQSITQFNDDKWDAHYSLYQKDVIMRHLQWKQFLPRFKQYHVLYYFISL